ncbi:MAG TPA: carboxypeptidase regulatory-like domain-containing protein [Gemmatimonadaceae bacterium]|nr:carboxypeptidase regulatory-like domain-containing protein [Gemmatimonadaceae bacterium]
MSALVFAGVLPAFLSAQTRTRTLSGVVADSSGARLAYSNVTVNNKSRVVADDSGRFQLMLDSGRVASLTIRRVGYETIKMRIALARDTSVQITLPYGAKAPPPEQITEDRRVGSLDRNGFYRRLAERHSGGAGHFVTPEEIEERRPYRASQVLEGIPGVRMRAGPTGDWAVMGLSRCPMTVYLDRSRLNSMSTRGYPVFIDDVVSGSAIAGIEVYASGVKPPAEFPPLEGTCGVLLVWTY